MAYSARKATCEAAWTKSPPWSPLQLKPDKGAAGMKFPMPDSRKEFFLLAWTHAGDLGTGAVENIIGANTKFRQLYDDQMAYRRLMNDFGVVASSSTVGGARSLLQAQVQYFGSGLRYISRNGCSSSRLGSMPPNF